MGYTAQKLGRPARISTRTLRYYDEIAPGAAVFFRNAMRIYTGIKE
jgi:hypothetical protein